MLLEWDLLWGFEMKVSKAYFEEFKKEFISELFRSFIDKFCLFTQIFRIIKADLRIHMQSFYFLILKVLCLPPLLQLVCLANLFLSLKPLPHIHVYSL